MSLLAHPSLSVRPPAVWPRPLGRDPLEPCELFSQRSALLDSNFAFSRFAAPHVSRGTRADGRDGRRPWDGHSPPPTRLRPHQKICRTQNPEGSKFPRVCWPKNPEVKQLVLHTYRTSDTNPARSSSLASHFAAADRRTRTRD